MMKRRTFVKASLLSGCLTSAVPFLNPAMASVKQKANKPEYYELRVYTLKNETQQKLVEDYFQNAAIPALNRLGSKNVGVFTEQQPTGQTKIYAIIPYKSLDDFSKSNERLLADATFQQKGAAYLNAPATEPAYERIESSLLEAFSGMPKMEIPANKPRIFELRRYESASEAAGKKKIEMFNIGEIAIFKRVGLTPVFFGEALIGEMRPNLTYLLTFDDMAEHDRNWKAFGGDQEWKKISGMPEYADAKIVSNITRTFLTPTSYSQI
ncbi:NIPSNAP family protein [Adhaeribacter radiodurans]|nr:NIPSNAP family protein [Adhaeribacter radiodurans]